LAIPLFQKLAHVGDVSRAERLYLVEQQTVARRARQATERRATMSAETNKALVRREFEKMFCQGAILIPPESFTPPTTCSTNRQAEKYEV
jgi:hypothetical protein